jgi:hypothetical protein
MERVFGWKREPIEEIYVIDVENGDWYWGGL